MGRASRSPQVGGIAGSQGTTKYADANGMLNRLNSELRQTNHHGLQSARWGLRANPQSALLCAKNNGSCPRFRITRCECRSQIVRLAPPCDPLSVGATEETPWHDRPASRISPSSVRTTSTAV